MFEHITIDNFRSIRHAALDGLKQINLFYGKNNCGKTSVLEAMFLLTGQSSPFLPITVNNLRGLPVTKESDFSLEFYNMNTANPIKLTAIGENGRSLSISSFNSRDGQVELGQIGLDGANAQVFRYGLQLDFSLDGVPQIFHSRIAVESDSIDKARIEQDSRYHERIPSQFLPSTYLLSLNVGPLWKQVVEQKLDKDVLDMLRIIEPRIVDVQLAGDVVLVDVGLQQRLPINVMGDGIRKCLTLVLIICLNKGGIVFVDEMENGLHFSVLPRLWQSLVKVATRNNTQLFVTTHSQDMLGSLYKALSGSDFMELKEHVAVHKLLRKEDDELIALHYGFDQIGYVLDQNYEIR